MLVVDLQTKNKQKISIELYNRSSTQSTMIRSRRYDVIIRSMSTGHVRKYTEITEKRYEKALRLPMYTPSDS